MAPLCRRAAPARRGARPDLRRVSAHLRRAMPRARPQLHLARPGAARRRRSAGPGRAEARLVPIAFGGRRVPHGWRRGRRVSVPRLRRVGSRGVRLLPGCVRLGFLVWSRPFASQVGEAHALTPTYPRVHTLNYNSTTVRHLEPRRDWDTKRTSCLFGCCVRKSHHRLRLGGGGTGAGRRGRVGRVGRVGGAPLAQPLAQRRVEAEAVLAHAGADGAVGRGEV